MAKNVRKIVGLGIMVIVAMVVWYIAYYMVGLDFRLTKTAELKAMERAAEMISFSSGKMELKYKNDFSYALGKPSYAGMAIDVVPNPGKNINDVFEEAISQFAKNNWQVESRRKIDDEEFYKVYWPQKRFVVSIRAVSIKKDNVVRIFFSTHLNGST